MAFALNDWSDVGDAATAATFVVAFASAVFAVGQVRGQARVAREIRATEAWDNYLRLCVDQPELSSVSAFQNEYRRSPNLDYRQNSKEDEKYLWFLSVLLNASEQVLLSAPNWRRWRDAIADQLSYHAAVLDVVWSGSAESGQGWMHHYSERMRSIVRDVLAELSVEAGKTQ